MMSEQDPIDQVEQCDRGLHAVKHAVRYGVREDNEN